jgi:hypothetical protein
MACAFLAPGSTYSADLDADGTAELMLIDEGRLTITDGDVVYRSRQQWTIVGSSFGDLDRDGLPEVVTLVDDDEGRHIGLFAYFGGEYRERIVTSEIVPAPAVLAVCDGEHPGDYEDILPAGLQSDVIVLSWAPDANQPQRPPAVYRWNGFGFTEFSP